MRKGHRGRRSTLQRQPHHQIILRTPGNDQRSQSSYWNDQRRDSNRPTLKFPPSRGKPREHKFSSRTAVFMKGPIHEEYNFALACRNWSFNSTGTAQHVVLAEEETWNECKQLFSSINFSPSEAETMLKKAFGWVHSPYWGEERSKELPTRNSVIEMLDYLRSLGLSDEDLHKLLKKFPEVLGCLLEDDLKMNVAALEKEWGIKGKSLRSLLLRNPKVLGYNVDCKGDCIAKCTRCWVRF